MLKQPRQHLDPGLWVSFKQGDKEVYALLYQTYFARLYNYGLKFTKDKDLVEDAIHDLFVKLWQHRQNLGVPISITNYLFKSLRGLLINKLTRGSDSRRHAASLSGYCFEVVPSAESDFIRNHAALERKAQVAKALDSLTARQREAIFLRFYEGLSYDEVADVMAVTVKAVYKIVARALVSLKESLAHFALLFLAGCLSFLFFHLV